LEKYLNNSQGEYMKLKTLVAVAIAGMLATSLGYAADPMTLADDSSSSALQPGSPSPDNVGATPNSNGSSMNSNSNTDNTTMPSDSNSTNNNDDMNADTATGDDDY
jgi:hypothetical protein